jgi:hypothetical protein
VWEPLALGLPFLIFAEALSTQLDKRYNYPGYVNNYVMAQMFLRQ